MVDNLKDNLKSSIFGVRIGKGVGLLFGFEGVGLEVIESRIFRGFLFLFFIKENDFCIKGVVGVLVSLREGM